MQLELQKKFKERLAGRIEKYSFEVGVLQDKPHKEAKLSADGSNLTTYAGGPVRKLGKPGPLSVAQVSAENRERLSLNYLLEPFKNRSADIIKFTEQFLKLVVGKSQLKRVENLLQAIVRNPILRGEYGRQSRRTTREKGFYRPMIDTGQLFKAIKAIARVKK